MGLLYAVGQRILPRMGPPTVPPLVVRLASVVAMSRHGRRVTRHLVVLALVAMVIAGCALVSRVPNDDAVGPTLDRWTSVGVTCGPPTKDAVPNALFQWNCRGDVGGVPMTIALDGDDVGVFAITAHVDASIPTEEARRAFAILVGATPVFQRAGEPLTDWLETWDGSSVTTLIGGGRFSLQRDETWVTFSALPGPRLHA